MGLLNLRDWDVYTHPVPGNLVPNKALFGTKLPGTGCVYTSQSLKFKRPIYVGDEVNTYIKVKSIDKKTNKIIFITQCIVNSKIAIDGDAEILIPWI